MNRKQIPSQSTEKMTKTNSDTVFILSILVGSRFQSMFCSDDDDDDDDDDALSLLVSMFCSDDDDDDDDDSSYSDSDV